ncbi:hypothetical protein C2G38_2237805 [Gigaspora rosea]|uniref:HCP-like protein n=1 Tax=Gigaspora rosea TaxID=44941 RepID=A0A397TPE8_9GLOM|nr:hypothetical protein C2G38_2237805 [Gigaspora rosea]
MQLNDNIINLSHETDNYEDNKKYQIPYTLIKPLESGFEAHKIKDRETAWKIFCAHADLGNITAKYWKGYYLSEGYSVIKDQIQACELFKETADYGIVDAQLDYAFSLLDNISGFEFDLNEFIKYLTKAADNGNIIAQFNLGDMYLHGKLDCKVDEKLGVKYLKLAALNNHTEAIEILKKLSVDIYDDCS